MNERETKTKILWRLVLFRDGNSWLFISYRSKQVHFYWDETLNWSNQQVLLKDKSQIKVTDQNYTRDHRRFKCYFPLYNRFFTFL